MIERQRGRRDLFKLKKTCRKDVGEYSINIERDMAMEIQKPCNQTNLESRQTPVDVKSDEWNGDGVSNATRVSVITSAYSLPNSTEENNDKINLIATSKRQEDKCETKKPYGGRPLKYECPQCQRRFHAPSHLKRHVMSHSSERPFQCNICGKGFLQAWHLGRHMTTHTGNKPFKCAECSKSFGSRFEMRTHINYIHKGIKEHKCEVCGKHFTLRSNLKVHMRKHTGEKPYQCTFCSKRFGQRGHLQYHIRKHEGKDEGVSSQQPEPTKKAAKLTAYVNRQHESISEQSECHDEDCECDSGIGSYDSEVESISCSSPVVLQDGSYDECQSRKHERPSSPEFALADNPRHRPTKRVYTEPQRQEVKPYVCYSCNCGFSEVSSLRAHARHSHPRKGISVGDYSCGFCLQHYSATEPLELHVEKHQFQKTAAFQEKNVIPCKSIRIDSPKSKMSPNSLAFSIENICANSQHSPKADTQGRSPLADTSVYEPFWRPVLAPSIPFTYRSNPAKGFTPSHSIGCVFTSQVSAFCHQHFDVCHLQVH